MSDSTPIAPLNAKGVDAIAPIVCGHDSVFNTLKCRHHTHKHAENTLNRVQNTQKCLRHTRQRHQNTRP